MTTFTDLPPEIRDMIYTLCLVEDREIFPYEERYDPVKATTVMPRTSLLQALLHVSKSVSAEAASIFYSKNTWRIGPSLSIYHFRIFKAWKSNKHSVRRVVLHITHYDVPRLALYSLSLADHYGLFEEFGEEEVLAFISRVLGKKGELQSICHSMRQILNDLETLSTLVIEVQDLFLGPDNRTLRPAALRGIMCSFHPLVMSLGASGCTTTIRGLQEEKERMIVQRTWPFAVAETSPPKLHMW